MISLDLTALEDEKVVVYIAFSPATIGGENSQLKSPGITELVEYYLNLI